MTFLNKDEAVIGQFKALNLGKIFGAIVMPFTTADFIARRELLITDKRFIVSESGKLIDSYNLEEISKVVHKKNHLKVVLKDKRYTSDQLLNLKETEAELVKSLQFFQGSGIEVTSNLL